MATDYKPKGLIVLAEYLKLSGLKYTPAEFAPRISRVPDAALNSIGYMWFVLDYDRDVLDEVVEAVYDSAGAAIPNADMFFSAFKQAAEVSSWQIIKVGFVEGFKDVGAKAAEAAESSRQVVELVTKAAPLIALVFLGGFLMVNFKKMSQ